MIVSYNELNDSSKKQTSFTHFQTLINMTLVQILIEVAFSSDTVTLDTPPCLFTQLSIPLLCKTSFPSSLPPFLHSLSSLYRDRQPFSFIVFYKEWGLQIGSPFNMAAFYAQFIQIKLVTTHLVLPCLQCVSWIIQSLSSQTSQPLLTLCLASLWLLCLAQ